MGAERSSLAEPPAPLRALSLRAQGQPRPLNHLRLPSDQRFAALLSPLKFTVVFDTDESHASRMEMRFSTAKMKDLVRQPSAGAPPPLVRSARLATNLLLLADRELLEADYASARQLLDAVHRSLNDPGAAAVINAQLEAMRRGAALARESSDGAGATSAGGGGAAPAQSSSPPADGAAWRWRWRGAQERDSLSGALACSDLWLLC